MPFFIFRGYDDPNLSGPVRSRVREAHRAYIRNTYDGVFAVAGGMVVTDSDDMASGTMLVLCAPDRDAAMKFLEGDPYWREGLFARWEVDRWAWGLGQPDDIA